MTKKEELLNFIESQITENKALRTVERIVVPGENSRILNAFDAGNKSWLMPKEILQGIIATNFDDDLVGQVPNDSNIIKILDWVTIDYVPVS